MDHDSVEEIKRYFGVVAEGLRSDVKAVAEGQSLTHDRLDRVDERLGELEQRGDSVDLRLDRLDQRAERLEQRAARVEQKVDHGFGELQSMIRLSYAEIDRRFGALESEVVDLRSRVERLEARGA